MGVLYCTHPFNNVILVSLSNTYLCDFETECILNVV